MSKLEKASIIHNLEQSQLYNRISYATIKFLSKPSNEKYLEHLNKFTTGEILECIKKADTQHKIKPEITVNSLKLSYLIFRDTGKLVLPIYYRTYSGKWQKSSGACSGLVYWFNEKYPNRLFEYMIFEWVNDMIKSNRHIIVQEPTLYNLFQAEIWSERK